jgi:ribosomal protein S2
MSNLTFKQIQNQVEAWIVDVNEELFSGMLDSKERMQLERDLEKLERISGELHVMNMHSTAFLDRIVRKF